MRQVLTLAASISVVWSGVTLAQTTHCAPTYPGQPALGMTCKTEQPSLNIAAHQRTDVGERIRSAQIGTGDGPSPYEQDKARSLRKKVGKLVAAGQCSEARATALSAGDLDLAEQSARLCVTAP